MLAARYLVMLKAKSRAGKHKRGDCGAAVQERLPAATIRLSPGKRCGAGNHEGRLPFVLNKYISLFYASIRHQLAYWPLGLCSSPRLFVHSLHKLSKARSMHRRSPTTTRVTSLHSGQSCTAPQPQQPHKTPLNTLRRFLPDLATCPLPVALASFPSRFCYGAGLCCPTGPI